MAEHPKRSPLVQSLLHYGQGLMMGAADIVPGISGGTVALIVGIYERLILSSRALASVPVDLVRGAGRSARRRIGEVYWWLVIPLGLGIVTALLVGARFIPEILDRYPVESRALFFGLIAGSLIIPWARIDRVRNIHYLAALVAAVVAFLIVGFPPREVMAPALPIVFLAASIAICAMILPGVSGSFLLLVMGMYEVTLNALNARDIPYVAVFILGAVVGLGVFSKLLGYLLDRHHDLTMAALVGLMLGALRALWPWVAEDRALQLPPGAEAVVVPLALAVAGFLFVFGVTRMGRRTTEEVEVERSAD